MNNSREKIESAGFIQLYTHTGVVNHIMLKAGLFVDRAVCKAAMAPVSFSLLAMGAITLSFDQYQVNKKNNPFRKADHLSCLLVHEADVR